MAFRDTGANDAASDDATIDGGAIGIRDDSRVGFAQHGANRANAYGKQEKRYISAIDISYRDKHLSNRNLLSDGRPHPARVTGSPLWFGSVEGGKQIGRMLSVVIMQHARLKSIKP